MKRVLLALSFVFQTACLCAQHIDTTETSRIMRVLAGDSLKGRGNLQPSLLKAADFIAAEFSACGLRPLPGFPSYFIGFHPRGWKRKNAGDVVHWNGRRIAAANSQFIHQRPGSYNELNLADFEVMKLDSSFSANTLHAIPRGEKPLLVWSAIPFKKKSPFPAQWMIPDGGIGRDVLLIVDAEPPKSLRLTANQKYYREIAYNVAAYLPGTQDNNDLFYLTAHYDHEGIRPVSRGGDSIFNGANDNASGTTALLRLAKIYSSASAGLPGIYFIAFAGEEMGLLGSEDLALRLPLRRTRGVINLEMLGVPQFGPLTVMIPEPHRSPLGKKLVQEFTREGISVVEDRDPLRMLFERSDNYPFHRRGIPAHLVMGSDDDDPCYHEACDELSRIDMINLSELIERIAKAARSIMNAPRHSSP